MPLTAYLAGGAVNGESSRRGIGTRLEPLGAAPPLVADGILAPFGCHAMIWSTVSVSLRQELIPGRLLGRVNRASKAQAATAD